MLSFEADWFARVSMIRIAVVWGALSLVCASPALAQSFTGYDLVPVGGGFNGRSPTGPAREDDLVLINRAQLGGSYSTSSLPLGSFASASDLAAANARIDRVERNSSALSSTLVGIASQVDRLNHRYREGIALAGAINVLPPNPGDTFAISFGGAGYGGTGAGSVAVSARLNEATIAYVGYARGPSQNLVKGGIGFSFK